VGGTGAMQAVEIDEIASANLNLFSNVAAWNVDC
jgi:hypothetical protein